MTTNTLAWRYIDNLPVLEVAGVTVIAGRPSGSLFMLVQGRRAAHVIRSWEAARARVIELTGVDPDLA